MSWHSLFLGGHIRMWNAARDFRFVNAGLLLRAGTEKPAASRGTRAVAKYLLLFKVFRKIMYQGDKYLTVSTFFMYLVSKKY